MGRKKKVINKEEFAESYCFVCKDGGLLMICDYGNCLKAYHPECVNKDPSFLETDDTWNCDWHSCFMCKKPPKFHCICCTMAVCACCLCDADFPVIGLEKGFCPNCLRLVAIIEGLSNQEKIDFDDMNTYESLFKNYWEIIKKELGLTFQIVCHAYNRLKKGQNDICADDFYNGEEELDGFESDDHLGSDYDDSNATDVEKLVCGRKRGRKPSKQKAIVKSKKKEFVGWASRSLYDFLLSIGKDPSKELSRFDVVDIISEYCKEQNLFDQGNKKKILCDTKLQAILKRKSVKKNNVYKHLNAHFAENFEQSDREFGYDSGDKVDNAPKISLRPRKCSSKSKSENEEIVETVVPKSCFASIIPENIKQVYLWRTVVEELLKQPETFDANVVGSFVRIRSDPYDYMQKNDYQLLQVAGIKKASGNGKENSDITMQFFNLPKDVRIRELSDADFSKEECQDLQRRVKDGLVKRPTVEELEKKARILHEVITKHQIASELSLLEKMINQANEKGWRKQLFDYVARRELLSAPEEQSRLLLEIPEIIAEELEVEPTDDFLSKKDEHDENCLPEKETNETQNSQRENSPVNEFRRLPNCGADSIGSDEILHSAEEQGSASGPIKSGFASEDYQRTDQRTEGSNEHCTIGEADLKDITRRLDDPSLSQLSSPENQCQPDIVIYEEIQVESVTGQDKEAQNNQVEQALDIMEISDDEEPYNVSRNQKNGDVNVEQGNPNKECEATVEVIELSDEEDKASATAVEKQVQDDPDSPIWYCAGHLGNISGPHQMSVLKQWMDSGPRKLKVRVWKIGQNPEEAVFLADAIHQVYGKQ